jgi:hypothetical protein
MKNVAFIFNDFFSKKRKTSNRLYISPFLLRIIASIYLHDITINMDVKYPIMFLQQRR